MGIRVLVCGGRNFNDREFVFQTLDDIAREADGIVEVIEGGAMGADYLGGLWAAIRKTKRTTVPADWRKHGRAAGPIRNSEMLALKPDLVIAFPGGKGTQDMIGKAERAGVRVLTPAWSPRL
jgi:hypothetical protein